MTRSFSIAALLQWACQILAQQDSPQREAEILLSYVLQCERSYLLAHGEKIITQVQYKRYLLLLRRRQQSEPIAYLLGRREFWSLDLQINSHTLIPRHETELLVELILKIFRADQCITLADLGTGCGAIALAIASERPHWEIIASDNRQPVLALARSNAQRLAINNITFCASDWCTALPEKNYDVIVSNPPYIAMNDVHLTQGDLPFEPQTALVSGAEGLDAICIIAQQATQYLKPSGYLYLEHGAAQAKRVADILSANGFNAINCYQDLAGLDRVTCGSY
ncbi:MAG: peptide chain release factor N(5)-glutamine methyltransferase [Gammaproteobacteria bacterium]|nr:peptide chain release factor N(5)-glutamine methyltransferase [Gammaproteobacteria bacterium]